MQIPTLYVQQKILMKKNRKHQKNKFKNPMNKNKITLSKKIIQGVHVLQNVK